MCFGGKWEKKKKFRAEEPSWYSQIIPCKQLPGLDIGAVNFHIYLKFGYGLCNVMSGFMNGLLCCFKLTVFSNHRGWLLLYNSKNNIICSTASNHLSPLVLCLRNHRKQGEIRCKKGLDSKDMWRGRKNKGGEKRDREWQRIEC